MNKLPYAVWKVGEQEYKLKFSSAAVVDAENKLGKSMLRSLEEIDKVSVQTILLWAAIQKFQHGVALSAVYELYDEYMEHGGGLEQLLDVLMKALELSGFMNGNQKKEQAAKTESPKA